MDIYTQHFGLRERPFTLVPNPNFIYWSKAHLRAMAVLEYGILTRAPVTLVTGEIGSGKTTLLRHLLREIAKDIGEIKVGLISNPLGGRDEMLRWILMALDEDVPSGSSYVEMHRQLETYLIEQYADGHRVVIIFDEAQNLDRDSLEQVRMLTNINADDNELVQLILVGQPELRDMIMRPDMVQLAQRVAANFFLPTLKDSSVAEYIEHRLNVAGATRRVFSAKSIELIERATNGVPRLINQLCDFAMLYAFEKNSELVSVEIVREVLDDGIFFAGGSSSPLLLEQEGATPEVE